MNDIRKVIAIIGGTGGLGSALAFRLGNAGYKILIGSRNNEKACISAEKINDRLGKEIAIGYNNREAAKLAEIIVLTIPFSNHNEIIEEVKEEVQGKIVVDTTVPLVPPKVSRVHLPSSGSIAKLAQEKLGQNVRLVSAFQNVAATSLDSEDNVKGEVLVCGNNLDARSEVISLIESIGLKGWHAGPIDNSVVTESLTPVLIFLNKRYKLSGSGISIVEH
tara:strand:- start:362 stop:1021 length:660 start_codon:yes stop_codon:yes gene_type:complete